MPETEVKIIKDAAETVYVSHPESGYGIFCYNSKGDLFLNSDYGMYGYAWRHYGDDSFRDFLKSTNADYILGKFETNIRFVRKSGIPLFWKKNLLNLIEAFIKSLQ